MQFTGSDPSKLTLEMFFDATDTMDDRVAKAVEKLFECCVPTDESLQQKKAFAAVGDLPLGRPDRLSRRT